jgi:hypothetical protein
LPKPKEYGFIHFALHGFFVSLALLPLMFFTGIWFLFGIRCIINAVLVGLWSYKIDNDFWEEWGRGFILVASLGLLL